MATLDELQAKALKVRELFARYEQQHLGKTWGTSEIMEGFVGDVGDLMKLVMAKQGLRETEDLKEKLAHELADCLWCVLVLADKLDVELEEAFDTTMKSLEATLKDKTGD